MKKFQIYLQKSPFIILYLQQIHFIQQILPNITQQSFQDQFEDFFMFFNDLLKSCPFLNQLFEQIIIHQLVLPILNYLLLNQKSDIQPEFNTGFFLIYQIIIKLPFKKIFIYFSEDVIKKESFDLPKYYYKKPEKWVYERQNYLEEFEQIYLDETDEKQINALQNQQSNDHLQNIYKSQMFQLLTPRKNSILSLQLAIWQIIQNNQKQRPISQIIQLLKHQDAVFYSKKVIDQIIFFLINEDINNDILLNIYYEYENKVKELINNCREQKTSLEALEANWELIQNLDWKTFKNSQPTFTLEDLQNWEGDNELAQFKIIYIWLLLKCLVMDFDKQSPKIQYIVNQEISYFNNDYYFQIDENRTYLIINPNLRYIILATTCSNPNKGKVSFAYFLPSLSCSKEDDYLKFESNKLAINRIKPFKVHIQSQSKDEIFSKILDFKSETFYTVDQLVKLIS
ncbi:unnamed protein product [Paramecium sonneborni]|uniref:FPL domain-containing protein n=1 Tax=Paramecium sonneborni TaxID=65129 RepID=A0A8S1M721_9CILI|nr:unnamed protein product [Paramecium sonneborni]